MKIRQLLPVALLLISPVVLAALDLPDMHINAHRDNPPAAFGLNQHGESLQQLDAEQLRWLGYDRLEDLADYLAGVDIARLGGGIGNDVAIRGFALGGRLLVDGVLDNQNYFVRDPSTLERIQIISGRNGALHGAGVPAGAVNLVTKKPLLEPAHQLQLSLGSQQRRRAVLDNTAALANSTHWAWRSILAVQQAQDWKKHVNNDSSNWLGSLSRIDTDSRLDLSLELARQQRPYDFDNVWAGGKPVYDVSYVMPASKGNRKHQRLRLDGHWQLDDQRELQVQLQWWRGRRDEVQAGFWFLSAAETPMLGYYQEVDERFRQRSGRVTFKQQFDTRLPQSLQLGLDTHSTRTDWNNPILNYFGPGPFFFVDIYHPDYRQPMPSADQLYLRRGRIRYDEHALFAQHQLQLPAKLRLVNGVRQNWFALDVQDTGTRQQSTRSNAKSTPTLLSNALIWQPVAHWSMHLSRNESFLPNSGLSASGSLFKPLLGEQHELGLLYQGRSLRLATNLYQAKQRNLLMPDAANPGFRKPLGALETQGIELLGQWRPTDQWQLDARLNHFVRTRISSNQTTDGKRFASIPRNSGSLTLAHQFDSQWRAQLGVVAKSRRPLNSLNTAEISGFTRLDAALGWQQTEGRHWLLGVQNLGNRDYVNYSTSRDFLRFGEPRTVRLELTQAL